MAVKHVSPEEFAKGLGNHPFGRPSITFGYRPKSAPVPEPTAEQRALIEDYLFAVKDAGEAEMFVRMMGTSTKAWRRAIERGQEATAAIREAGITEAMIAKVRAEPSAKA